MRRAALVAAAGAGERLGLGPKAFVELAGRTLLERAVAAVEGVVDEVVVALPAGREAEGARLAPRARFVAGGADRQATIAILLEATRADLVLVHDAARPLVPASVVRAVLAAAERHGAATAGVRVADTLHDLERDAPVPRDGIGTVQTPQGFDRALLLRAHAHARERGVTATDDAGLVRAIGQRVAWVEGSPWSHKITGPADLALLEALARGAVAEPERAR